MEGTRKRFHHSLADLEAEVVEAGRLAEHAVGESVRSIVHRDDAVADAVIAGDDEIDSRYLDIEKVVLDTLALQTPVASDLRLVSAIMHINLHVERIGDQAVNIAKMSKLTRALPSSPVILSHLEEMSALVCTLIRASMEAFERRDLELCMKLPEMDDPVDALNRGMLGEVVKLADDPAKLEWGISMNVVARHLERAGDNAVDIAEQVSFLLTGEFKEFTDASHDES
ncbi:MAG TPA: phosphate signaling complex protein PhoU [Actinomycetota bacterium]|jgi:phosphate transport system protein